MHRWTNEWNRRNETESWVLIDIQSYCARLGAVEKDRRIYFKESDLILAEEGIETGQPFGEFHRQLNRQNRHLGDVLELGLAVRFVNS